MRDRATAVLKSSLRSWQTHDVFLVVVHVLNETGLTVRILYLVVRVRLILRLSI